MVDSDQEPKWRAVDDLARDLMLAQEIEPGRGRAVFLIGAGCSVSAGIPAAKGVARHCAVHLAGVYSRGHFTVVDAEGDGEGALSWLVEQGHVPHDIAYAETGAGPDWSKLYTHFFEEHLKAPNQQRNLISKIVDDADGQLNWAHACLGELVRQRYVHSILTTNFDQLVLTGIFRAGLIPVVADGMSALNRIVAKPLVPQVVHLHGSMHTYNLRNSRRSLSETKDDARAVTMMNGILQQCDVLVVVGYAGGEEGVMELLLEASRHHEQLVIYWVLYERDVATLSGRCRKLLLGENKFAIDGGEADKFFGDLMAKLEIGQPGWVGDPVGELDHQSKHLVTPAENSAVSILIGAFQGKVTTALDAVKRWRPKNERKLAAAEKRAAGDFRGARSELDGVPLVEDPEAARLHALNALSLFEESPTASQKLFLDAALAEFDSLINVTSGEDRMDNVLSLTDAKLDLFELEGNAEPLREVVSITTKWLENPSTDVSGQQDGRLLYNRALAHHRLAEVADENESELELAERDYRAALLSDRTVSVLEVQESLAAVLQVLGRKRQDIAKIREAVRLFREVTEHTRRNVASPERGGQLYNLSGALIDLISGVDQEEQSLLAAEAARLLDNAETAFHATGDADRLTDVQARKDQLRSIQVRLD